MPEHINVVLALALALALALTEVRQFPSTDGKRETTLNIEH